MSTSTVITILNATKSQLAAIGWCQGSYGLDAAGAPVTGLAGCLAEGLTGLDLCGAIYRACYLEGLMGDRDEALSAVAQYILASPPRESTPGCTIRDWNDEPGRQAENIAELLDTVVTMLSA